MLVSGLRDKADVQGQASIMQLELQRSFGDPCFVQMRGSKMTRRQRLVEIVHACSDIAKLQNWIINAEREGATEVADSARRRMIEVEALKNVDDANDSLVLDFWKGISALEFALCPEGGKTIRLSRTRQKIARIGVRKTLGDLAVQSTPSEGYFLLRDRGMLDVRAEAEVLRFPEQFGEDVVQAARMRQRANDGSTHKDV